MARFKIYSKDGQTVRYEGCPKYNGTYLKVSYLEFSSIASPTPIAWQVGDYVDYPRTGLRYTLRSIPSVRKKAKSGQTGDAFVYQNVQFMAQTQDLAVAPFIDLVPEDNGVHFSTQSAVSTFENAYGIAARIQACLDDLFPGVWDVKVYENLDEDFEKKISEAVDFSIDGGSCLEACDRMYDTWGIGWTHYKDSASGKDVLLFGRPNTRTSDNTSPDFVFGPGSGLTALKKSVANSDEIGTRLRVFGSSRNIPTSYYRGLDIYNGESVDIQNLMIPLSKWGKTDGKPDARKAYLQASDQVVAALGLIPRTHYFDGSDGEEIYPSLEGVTVGAVRAAKQELQDTTYVPSQTVYPDASERVDEIESATNPEDDGYSGGSDGSKYKDTQVVSYAGVNRQQVHVSSNVRPEQYGDPTVINYFILNQISLIKDDAVTVESGMEGYIEDANGIIYSDAGSVKVVLTLRSGTSANGNLASKAVDTTKEGNRYNFRLPEITLERPSDYTKINLELIITVKASRSADSFFYVNLSGCDFLLGEYTPIKGDFTLTLKQIGFDISQRASLTADGLARIYMVDGMNAGRSFYVRSCSYTSDSDTWLLGMYRTEDESTGMRYPNSQFPINPGDHFLLLDIAMPELYVGIASQKLYEKGLEMLNDISRVKPYYEPEVDAIVMTEQARVLREGMYMRLTDADIAGDSSEYVLIDTLTINEGEAEIPTYKVGLREYKKKTFQETTKAAIDDISQKASGGSSDRPSSSAVQSYDALSDKPKIDGVTLEGDRDSYNELGLINKSIFELVNIGTEESPLMAIKAKYGLFSNSFISARGSDPEAGSGGSGGLDVQAMWYALAQPTGEQINVSHIPDLAISKITGLQDALDAKLEGITKAMVEAVLTGTVTSHNHDGRYAPLSGGLIPPQYLPSYVDDVVEYASMTAFPATGEAGKIYVALDTNLTYRWGGSSYVEISPSLALGHTSGTAYPGDEGAALAERVEAMKAITDLFGIDADGNVYVKDNKGFWSNSFISARGSDPEAGSGDGSGVDMASVWYALAQPTNEKINASHIPAIGMDKVSGLADALAGKLSGITGEMVTEALGYTPYDASKIGSASVKYAASAGKVAHALSIVAGDVAAVYDGSAAKSVTVPTAAQMALWDKVGGLFDVDEDGNVYVKDNRGFYGNSFVSARGSDPEAGQGGGGSGVDMESVWYALGQPTTEKINVSHIPALQQLSGQITNAQLANSAITVAGVRVSLGGAVTTAQIASALGLGSNAYTSTAYLPLAGGTMTGLLNLKYSRAGLTMLDITNTAGGEVFLRTYSGSTYAGAFTTNHKSYGTAIFNAIAGQLYLGITNSGVPHFQGNPLLHFGNYTNYTVTKTGGGASGTWGISISGLANRAVYLKSTYTGSGGLQPPSYFNGMGLKVNMMNKPVSYCDVIFVNGYNGQGSDVPYVNALAFQKTANAHGEVYHARGDYGGSSWGTWYKFLDEYNYPTTLDTRYVKKSGDTMNGTLTLLCGGDNYDQGIRINRPTLADWATLTIGCVGSGTSGTTANTWLIGTPANRNSLIFCQNDSSDQKGLCLRDMTNTGMRWNGYGVWHSGNDGSGSGLDADLLDGKHYSDIINGNVASATKLATARSIWGQSFNGTRGVDGHLFLGSPAYRLYFGTSGLTSFLTSANGIFQLHKSNNTVSRRVLFAVNLGSENVGIGTTAPTEKLHVVGSIRATTGIWSDGYVSAKGQDTTSDARYKRDIASLPAQAALAVLMRLRPSTWAWKDDGRRGAGFVAQEVLGVLPEAVREVGNGEDRHLALNYQMLHAYEVSALQTHETELERLRGRVNQLENEIKRIRHGS